MRTGAWLFPELPARDLVDVAATFDREGVDDLWLGDEGPAREPFTVLAAAATQTTRLRLGVGVTNPYTRHPAMSALAMMTVHELSGGRAALGIGAGGSLSLAPFGLTAERPLARVRDAIRMSRAVTRGEAAEGYDPPAGAFTAPDLPIVVGAKGERLNRLASAEADGVFVAGVPPFLMERVVGWARTVGRPTLNLYVSVAVERSDAEAIRPRCVFGLLDAPADTARRLGLDRDALTAAAEALQGGDEEPARRLVTDEVLDQVIVTGSVDEIARRVVDLGRALRADAVGVAVAAEHPVRAAEHSLTLCRTIAKNLA